MSRFETKQYAFQDWSDSKAPKWSRDTPREWVPQYTDPLRHYPGGGEEDAHAHGDRRTGDSHIATEWTRPPRPAFAPADLEAPPEVTFRDLESFKRTGPILCLYAVSGLAALALGVYASQALVSLLISPSTRSIAGQSEDTSEEALASDAAGALPQGLTPEGAAAAGKVVRSGKPARSVGRASGRSRGVAAGSTRPATALRGVESVPVAPNAVPDMDLTDIPSSPMEREALARSRASHSYSSAALIEEQAARDPLGKLDLLQEAGTELGMLHINSRPWSQVYVDKRPVGTTPVLALSLSSGPHNIQLVNEQFGMSKSFDIQLEPGESISRVVSLEP